MLSAGGMTERVEPRPTWPRPSGLPFRLLTSVAKTFSGEALRFAHHRLQLGFQVGHELLVGGVHLGIGQRFLG